ncbi:MAG TPA: hypothetical protein DEF03_04810 [Bacteroidetes bacterium]|nr:hypothetical protein [Bacteroidota bacterium]
MALNRIGINRHKKMPELPFTTIPALTNLLSLGEQKMVIPRLIFSFLGTKQRFFAQLFLQYTT